MLYNQNRMRYLSANQYYRQKYGKKMYKASISLATSCPNRDGTCGHGGCAFCSEQGSGDFASGTHDSVTVQIDKAIEKVSAKTDKETGYIAYFQSFTSTYVKPDVLRDALNEAAFHPMVEAISIATRPDCLGDGILSVIAEFTARLPVSVELGLQTSSDDVALAFGRGYKTEVYDAAVRALKALGAEVVTHVIFGLPGESREDMLNSVRHAVDHGTDGLKFTCLFLLEGTRYGELYKNGGITPLEMEEYFDIVEAALELVPDGMPILRVTGDGPKKILLAPLWTANKRAVVNYINRRFGQ